MGKKNLGKKKSRRFFFQTSRDFQILRFFQNFENFQLFSDFEILRFFSDFQIFGPKKNIQDFFKNF